MRPPALPRPLRGIITPMVTPLLDRDSLDIPGLERLIEHILAGGVHGLFLLGTTGEAPSLSYRLRKELITRACKQVNNRLPVLVGITDTSFVESVNVAVEAQKAGARASFWRPHIISPPANRNCLNTFNISHRNSLCRFSCITCPPTQRCSSNRRPSAMLPKSPTSSGSKTVHPI